MTYLKQGQVQNGQLQIHGCAPTTPLSPPHPHHLCPLPSALRPPGALTWERGGERGREDWGSQRTGTLMDLPSLAPRAQSPPPLNTHPFSKGPCLGGPAAGSSHSSSTSQQTLPSSERPLALPSAIVLEAACTPSPRAQAGEARQT